MAIATGTRIQGINEMNEHEYAGFWIRVGAALIDTVIFLIVIMIPLSIIYGQQYWQGTHYIYGFWDVILGYVVPIVATVWFWLRFMGTPGKMALKLRIVDASTGNKLSVGQAIGRYFAYILSILPFGLGFIWVGIDRRKQGWHDKLAGTVVIRDSTPVPVKFDSQEWNSAINSKNTWRQKRKSKTVWLRRRAALRHPAHSIHRTRVVSIWNTT